MNESESRRRGKHAGLRHPKWSVSLPNRIIALDLARLLAIVGMMAQHLLYGQPPGVVEVVTTGFPSTLFAVLGGISTVVSTRKYRDAGRPRAAMFSVVARGATVAVLGVLLIAAPRFVIVVLLYYGIALMITALFLRARSSIVVSSAVVLALGVPQLSAWVAHSDQTAGPVVGIGSYIFLIGPYPVATWVTYMLIGVLVGRTLTAKTRPQGARILTLVGAVMFFAGIVADELSRPAVIASLRASGMSRSSAELTASSARTGSPIDSGWIAVLNGVPHSGTTADVLKTAGAALIVIAVMLFLTLRFTTTTPAFLRPLVAAGAAPLTIYTLHVLVTTIASIVSGDKFLSDPAWWELGPYALGLHIAGALAVGIVLLAWRRKGPLETLVSKVANAGARLAEGRVARRT